MQLNRLWSGLILASMLVIDVHAAGPLSARRPERIRNRKYGFSVVFPKAWYVWEGAGLPTFFNYSAEDAPPQGLLPPHGASIAVIMCRHLPKERDTDDVSACADREVRARSGVTVGKREISGPVSGAPALWVDFEERALAREGDAVRLVVIFWQLGGRAFGARLEYIKGDPDGPRYERTMIDVVESFRPL